MINVAKLLGMKEGFQVALLKSRENIREALAAVESSRPMEKVGGRAAIARMIEKAVTIGAFTSFLDDDRFDACYAEFARAMLREDPCDCEAEVAAVVPGEVRANGR